MQRILKLFVLSSGILFGSHATLGHGLAVTIGSDGGSVSRTFSGGSYEVHAIGGGWNPFGGDVSLPERGWSCALEINVSGVTKVIGNSAGYQGSPGAAISSCTYTDFQICETTSVSFFTVDGFPDDNIGSITVDVVRVGDPPASSCPPSEVPYQLPEEDKEQYSVLSGALAGITHAAIAVVGSILGGFFSPALLVVIAFTALAVGLLAIYAPAGLTVPESWLSLMAAVSTALGVITAGATTVLLGALLAIAVASAAVGVWVTGLANDPPDFNYHEVVEPQFEGLLFDASVQVDDRTAEIYNSLIKVSEYSRVSLRSLEKLQGAAIEGNEGLETEKHQAVQLRQLVQMSSLATNQARNAARAIQALRNQLAADGISDVVADQSAVSRIQQLVGTYPITSIFQADTITALGLPIEEAQEAWDAFSLRLQEAEGATMYQTMDQFSLALLSFSDLAESLPIKIGTLEVLPEKAQRLVPVSQNALMPISIITTSVSAGDSVDFDATEVRLETIVAGPLRAIPAHNLGHFEDIDGDGDLDLQLHFRVGELGLDYGTGEDLVLAGVLADGRIFYMKQQIAWARAGRH